MFERFRDVWFRLQRLRDKERLAERIFYELRKEVYYGLDDSELEMAAQARRIADRLSGE